MQFAIETQSLEKRYAGRSVVRGLDLRVPPGAVYGFLGPNGAGKTTTIRLLLGLIAPTAGSIEMFGLPMPARRTDILRRVGAIVEAPTHYDHLTGRENLAITIRILGCASSQIDRVLSIVGLSAAARVRVGHYSLGMRQRLGIARALIGAPELLILDEPSNGLDPDGIREMRDLIRSLPHQQGCTVLLCSHLLSEVEQVASHVGLMWGGRLLAQGSLADVLGRHEGLIELEADRMDEASELLALSGLSPQESAGGKLTVGDATDPAAINFLLTAAGLSVSHLCRRERSLEDIYIELTRHDRLLESCR